MNEARLGAVETRFAHIVWDHAPLTTAELVRLCEQELAWKRTTTYTVLKRLCERGLFKTENSVVSALVSRDEYYSSQSTRFVEEHFSGSLPAFVAAFTSKRALSAADVAELQALIDNYGKES